MLRAGMSVGEWVRERVRERGERVSEWPCQSGCIGSGGEWPHARGLGPPPTASKPLPDYLRPDTSFQYTHL